MARRRRNILLAVGAAALVAAAIALGAILFSSSDSDAAQALEDAGCTQQMLAGQPGTHVQSLTATPKPKWNSNPPTSGPHYFQPAIWGFYSDPVPLIQSVHNLEHGGIVVHYGSDVTQETVAQLRTWYDESPPNGLLVAPLPSLTPKNTIALSAWTAEPNEEGNGYLAKCTEFDETAFSAFRDEHRYQGPERFPSDALLPGN